MEGVQILLQVPAMTDERTRKRRKFNGDVVSKELDLDRIDPDQLVKLVQARAEALVQKLKEVQACPSVSVPWTKIIGPTPLTALTFCMVYRALKVHVEYNKCEMLQEKYETALRKIGNNFTYLEGAVAKLQSGLYEMLTLADPTKTESLLTELYTEIVICEHALWWCNEHDLPMLAQSYKLMGNFHTAVVDFTLSTASKRNLVLESKIDPVKL